MTSWTSGPSTSPRGKTDITNQDLDAPPSWRRRSTTPPPKQESNVDAASAQELRNRCFWATDELAKEIREGGRYAFRAEPMTAAKFVSRYRASVARRANVKRKIKLKAKKQAEATKPEAPEKEVAAKAPASKKEDAAPAGE